MLLLKTRYFFVKKEAPTEDHEVLRRWQKAQPLTLSKEEKVKQLEVGKRVFRQETQTSFTGRLLPLEAICYLSVGMVLNADDKRFKGAFVKDDLISETKDSSHPEPYLEGKDLDTYEIENVRYLEYGLDLRAPRMIRRPTFSKLYEVPKIIRGRTSSATLDKGDHDHGFFYVNHSVIVIIPWHSLSDTDNRSITSAVGNNERSTLESYSRQLLLHYLLGIINSELGVKLLVENRSSVRSSEIEPEALKALPVKIVPKRDQLLIAKHVRKILSVTKGFMHLRSKSWIVDTNRKLVISPALSPSAVPSLALSSAKVRWHINVKDRDADVTELRVKGNALIRGKAEVLELPSASPRAVEWLRRQLATLEPGTSFSMAEARGLEIPASPAHAEKALAELEAQEERVKADIEEFHRLRAEVDDLVAKLYESA